ncbi:hypothetical protein GAO09_04940 [Rhizobiales bacterium RZME27]|jgi:hypothetical protein|uniref:Uncharacterized protein n=1 Tax=Endobacterium cereale TaxID=2663029 RepID=A0A6A8A6Y4_9HYPH|nr:hypothetical protein [Endobacterium cereale]MEB2846536.1 hypothetical protein [Endobacterium cereale]MQY45410.1 hypothetical protein [Endobacterium cereale]
MLLMNINVAKTTDTTVTVEFKGEGNDLITVRMSADPSGDEDQAVAAALAMIRQLNEFQQTA